MYLSFRLLTELYSFLRPRLVRMLPSETLIVSVSLRSYIHSYFKLNILLATLYLFPSPYGVIFILTFIILVI